MPSKDFVRGPDITYKELSFLVDIVHGLQVGIDEAPTFISIHEKLAEVFEEVHDNDSRVQITILPLKKELEE